MASISVTTLAYVAAAGAVASAGVAAYSSHEQGVATANADKRKARVESEQATQQQIQMRQRMLTALASQNAGSLGAVGTGANTGFGANVKRQLNEGQNDLLVNSANSSAQVSLLDQAAGNAAAAGNLGAAGDAVGGLASAAGILSRK
jgi:type II secretory pathway component HofQ